MENEVKELTDEELDAELAQRAKQEEEIKAVLATRIENMVNTMVQVLAQFEASNSESLGAAFTLASRLIKTAIGEMPAAAPSLREMALRLLLHTADPRPADANIQIAIEVGPNDEASTTE